MNNELAKSEPTFLVEIQGILSAAGPNISVNQSVHSLVLCAFLSETVNTELTVSSPVTQAWRMLLQHTHFLWKPQHSLLHLGTLRQHLSITLLGHFKQQNCQPEAQKCKYFGTKCHQKDVCLWYESQNKKTGSPCLASAGNVHVEQLTFSSLCACLQITIKMIWVLTWRLQIGFSKEANSERQIPWIMKTSCGHACVHIYTYIIYTDLHIHMHIYTCIKCLSPVSVSYILKKRVVILWLLFHINSSH